MTLADDIRSFAAANYIEPARKGGSREITIVVGEVHTAMGLKGRVPAVCSALRARAFEAKCGVAFESSTGPHQSTTTKLSFLIDDALPVSAKAVPTRHKAGELLSTPGRIQAVTSDELARWRRNVVRLLDGLEVHRLDQSSPRSRITRLSREGVIPRETASLMIAVTEMRNAAEYNRKVLSQSESDAIRGAWGAVSEWARERGIEIEQ